MKVFAPVLVASACLALTTSARAMTAPKVTAPADAVAVDELAEIRVDLDATYANPFDPDVVSIDAAVRTPSGATQQVAGFFTRAVSRTLEDGKEVLRADGAGSFVVRYAPREEGSYEVVVTGHDALGDAASAPAHFTATPRKSAGFVRISPRDPMALAYDDGTPYLAVGANVAWSVDPSAGYDMDRYLESMAAAGMTWTRLWLTHYGQGWSLEWNKSHPSGYYEGLGRYSVEIGARLDHVFEKAASLGIAVQLVLWQHSQLEAPKDSAWSDNPYNAANGGPAHTSAEFFTSAEAVALSQKKLRYLVARFGAYRSLFAFEVMNEMDVINAPAAVVTSWCDARAAEIHALDVHGHLVTTSHAIRPSVARPEALASSHYDIVQSHGYGRFDPTIADDVAALRTFGKPMLFGEFGLDYDGVVGNADDLKGLHLAEASWMSLASGYGGGAMSWWWDTYLRPRDLWSTQAAIARVARAVSFEGLHGPLSDQVTAQDAAGTSLEWFGRRSDGAAVVFVQHPDAAWEVASVKGAPDVRGATLRFPDARAADVVAFDTKTGAELARSHVDAADDGALVIPLPPFVGSVFLALTLDAAAAGGPGADPPSASGCAMTTTRSRSAGAFGAGVTGAAILAIAACVRWRRSRARGAAPVDE